MGASFRGLAGECCLTWRTLLSCSKSPAEADPEYLGFHVLHATDHLMVLTITHLGVATVNIQQQYLQTSPVIRGNSQDQKFLLAVVYNIRLCETRGSSRGSITVTGGSVVTVELFTVASLHCCPVRVPAVHAWD